MPENLARIDIDVGIDAAEAGGAADVREPGGSPDGDLPRFRRVGGGLRDHFRLLRRTRPSCNEGEKEKGD